MAARKKGPQASNVGYWAFLIGVVVAIVAGIVVSAVGLSAEGMGLVAIILVVLGIVVGFLNLLDKEYTGFLLAVIVLAVVGATSFNALGAIGNYLTAIISMIAAFVAPAAIIVALKSIWDLATA